ncbi:3-phosphoshikimate 1-carboxyvinyltransferase [Brachybacterium huguangmaarense]
MNHDVTWTAPVATAPVDALIRVPGSKSLTARWMLLAALAGSTTTLIEPLNSRDTRIMLDALEQLGAVFTAEPGRLRVEGIRPVRGERSDVVIHTGLAGTVMRFVPVVAALHDGDVRFTGDDAALARPMGPVVEALRGLGVRVTEHGEPGRLPITVHGRGELSGGRIDVDASASSQFLSNLLLAGARASSPLELRHVGEVLPSLPHIEMTLEVLARAGVRAEHAIDAEGLHTWRVEPGPIDLGEILVEPDLSNAGPFLAAAMVAGGTVEIADWPEATTQPGDSYRELLTRMGARVESVDSALELTGTGEIHGVDADMSAVGELTPVIAGLAALADGPSHLRGIGHLRGHETDRIHALAVELEKVGCRTVEHPESLEIHPGPLHGAVFETYEDHRIAHAGAIIGLRVPDVRIVNIETTQKTLPDFVGMWLSMLHTDSPAGLTW